MSLVRTLMSGVTESAVDVSGFDYSAEASMESYWLDAACESLVTDIYNVDKAYLTADVIGEVKTVTEGADPQVLLEGMISTGIEKLKEAFKKFLAKIKEWAAKVKRFFQILFMKGKDFTKQFGSEIRRKSVKGFTYSGFDYDIDGGDTLVDNISGAVDSDIDRLLGGLDKASVADGDAAVTDIIAKSAAVDTKASTSDYQDKLCKTACKGASDISEMLEKITETYHNGDDTRSDIDDFEGKNDPSDMISFIEGFDKAVKDIEKEEKDFEKQINKIVKQYDKAASTSKKDREADKTSYTDKNGGAVTTDVAYKAASKVSGYLSAALTVKKSAVDKKVQMYKEINGAFTATLKSFLRFKGTKESYDFSGADEIISLTEAGDVVEPDVSAEEPMDEEKSKYGSTEESKCGTKEAASLFEAAYKYL